MRSQRTLPHSINPQLRKLPPNPLPQFLCKLELKGIRMRVVDVDIEAATDVVCDGRGEGGVGL